MFPWLLLLTVVCGETILGSFIFQRHGDRLQKPTPYLTPVGTHQCEEAGSFFNYRYFNESAIHGLSPVYNASQFSIMTPASEVLFKSMVAWTQGFYPPLSPDQWSKVPGANVANSSGTTVESSELSLQYVFIDAIDEASSQYWTVEGGAHCPNQDAARASYMHSSTLKDLNSSSSNLYEPMANAFQQGGFNMSKYNFANAFTVYDHFLTQFVHNETFMDEMNGSDIGADRYNQLQYLQDQYTKGLNVQPNNTHAMTAGRSILGQVSEFLSSKASNSSAAQRVQVLGGSYDEFYQLFALLNFYHQNESLFTGIVSYASSLVFELYTPDDSSDSLVRVGIRNGTSYSEPGTSLDFYPVFNSSDVGYPLEKFLSDVKPSTITSLDQWCNDCDSKIDACIAKDNATAKTEGKKSGSNLTLAGAGGIGAGVTIFVFLVIGALGWFIMTRGKKHARGANQINLDNDTLASNNDVKV